MTELNFSRGVKLKLFVDAVDYPKALLDGDNMSSLPFLRTVIRKTITSYR